MAESLIISCHNTLKYSCEYVGLCDSCCVTLEWILRAVKAKANLCAVRRFMSSFSAVYVVSLDPVADLSVFKRSDAHRHVELLRSTSQIHPLVPGENPDDFTLPTAPPGVPHAHVNSGATGARLSVAALVQQVVGFVSGLTEAVNQVAWTVVVETRKLHSFSR